MTKITTDKERRGQKAPQTDMCILLIRRQMSIVLIGTPSDLAYDKHIGVVKMTRIGKRGHRILAKSNVAQALPGIGDIPGGSPAIAADGRTPVPDIPHAVLAKAKNDIPWDTVQGGAHDDIRFFQGIEALFEIGKIAVGAQVIFQVIDTPLAIGAGILKLMLPAS